MGKTYVPEDFPIAGPLAHVYVDGREVYEVVAANPSEGWVEVFKYRDGDNFTQRNGTGDGHPFIEDGEGLKVERLTGIVTIKHGDRPIRE